MSQVVPEKRTEMGKIVMSDNVALDGAVQDPAGDEGFRVGGWVGLIAGHPELAKFTLDEALGAEALLLGRRSYEWVAARWPSRSGEWADRLNSMPKFVASSSARATSSARNPAPCGPRPAARRSDTSAEGEQLGVDPVRFPRTTGMLDQVRWSVAAGASPIASSSEQAGRRRLSGLPRSLLHGQ